MALGTFFGVRSDPIARFTVIVTLLLPLLQPFAFDRLVPRLATLKTKRCTASCTDDHCHVAIRCFNRVGAVRSRTPAHVAVALNERVSDQMLVLLTDFDRSNKLQHGLIID